MVFNHELYSRVWIKLINNTNCLNESVEWSSTNELFDSSSMFFNATSILDIFFSKDENTLYIPYIQDALNVGTYNFIKTIKSVHTSPDSVITQNVDLSLFNSQTSTWYNDIISINNIVSGLVKEIHYLTAPRNNAELMVNTFPQHADTFDVFEILSCNWDNSLYDTLSTPDFKLYYPEPFIASPSFIHEEVWFIHILHYQHWLWFMFISLVMFYFIVFINVVRWCNPRNKPRRETRGVSRSKCADLITACVPVSWAISIIISESVDAADYYDGFGTGEVVIGIRAYQWGWEYFFPKCLDLNYKVSPSYSKFVGNSLKYNNTSDAAYESNSFWKNFNSKKLNKLTSTPAHLILAPSDNIQILNFMHFNNVGANTLKTSSAFKKIQFASKTNAHELFNTPSAFSLKYNKIASLYLKDLNLVHSSNYGTLRQHNYTNTLGSTNTFTSHMDTKSTSRLMNYNNSNSSLVTYNNQTLSILDAETFNNTVELNSKQTQNATNLNTKINYNKVGLRPKPHKFSPFDRSLRNPQNLATYKGHWNLQNYTVAKSLPNSALTSEYSLESQAKFTVPFLKNTKTMSPTNHTPTLFIGSKLSDARFDRYTALDSSSTPMKLDPDLATPLLFGTYWTTLWAQTSNIVRLSSLHSNYNRASVGAIPSIVEYNDYNFTNWVALDLLEDAIWESVQPSTQQTEYFTACEEAEESFFDNLEDDLFNYSLEDDEFNLNDFLLDNYTETLNEEKLSKIKTLTPSLFTADLVTNTQLLTLHDFEIFPDENLMDTSEDSYDNLKFVNYIHHLNFNNPINILSSYRAPLPYTQVLNSFRPNSEDNILFGEEQATSDPYTNDTHNHNNQDTMRASNNTRLRSTAKNAIVTYNSMLKVFKTRYDESRSHANLTDASNSTLTRPFINEAKTPYELLLGKNKESFYVTGNYNSELTDAYSAVSTVLNTLNIYFSDIPFLLSMQSDPARYMWFDWSSRWNSIEIQPSSVSRYSLIGLPYLTKNFEYSTGTSKELKDSETYLLRLSRARKNYMSNWAFTPYFYSRAANWFNTNPKQSSYIECTTTRTLHANLKLASGYWTRVLLFNRSTRSTPSFSSVNTPGRSSWKPETFNAKYHYNTSTLVDILTKREFIYRDYFLTKGYSVSIPKYLLSNPSNSLFIEVCKSYPFIDPSTFSSELSRDFFYSKTDILRYSLLYTIKRNIFSDINSFVNLPNHLFSHLLNLETKLNNDNVGLFKNQFRPMKKGVNNMIRLHATGAVAMPIEIRLHILASSKDVIHSWAIPSAGIKIDCIPGYSSHRVAIFLVSGIFWGQCMEVCGRFHHWMPIVVYFMKRDLFFLWCTHFIHYSNTNNTFNMTDRQLVNHIRLVTFDRSTWINDIAALI